jgi:hypothetical protein
MMATDLGAMPTPAPPTLHPKQTARNLPRLRGKSAPAQYFSQALA